MLQFHLNGIVFGIVKTTRQKSDEYISWSFSGDVLETPVSLSSGGPVYECWEREPANGLVFAEMF